MNKKTTDTTKLSVEQMIEDAVEAAGVDITVPGTFTIPVGFGKDSHGNHRLAFLIIGEDAPDLLNYVSEQFDQLEAQLEAEARSEKSGAGGGTAAPH